MTKEKAGPTPPRKFTDSFKLGQMVSIIRTKHGWFDGHIKGKITKISDFSCQVTVTGTDTDDAIYDIPKPRDIS